MYEFNHDSNPQEIDYDGNQSGLYLYCEMCGKDITLAVGVEDDTCRECLEEL